jgi:PAS domain S-box-containing protein
MEVISGYSRQELLEMNFWDTVHPDFRDAVRERGLARLRGEPLPTRYEFKIVTKGGEERWVDFTDGIFELDGKPAVIGMSWDITERKRAEGALKTTSEQLRALTAKIESVREEEDRRIGREIHDEIGSAMTGLKWDLEGLDKLCSETSGQIDCSLLRERIKGMVALIDTTSRAVQKISSELRPAILDDLGLIPAVESQAQEFSARTGIVCQFDSLVESIDLDREKATAVFRIIQEALTNILRHSRATRVNIIIEKDDDELIVEIKDNGRGITEAEKARPSSLGLIGMQERTRLIKGKIEIIGFPGKGTALTLRVPFPTKILG